MSVIILYAIPAFIVLMLVEGLWLRHERGARGYERRDTASSLAMGIGHVRRNLWLRIASKQLELMHKY